MASEADICNIALLRAGTSETISGLDQQNKQGRVANTFYAMTRDVVLADFDWNFARKRVALTPSGEAPPTNWTFAFALPNDCLRPRRLVVAGARAPKVPQRIPYEISGRVLFTDEPNPELIYTRQVDESGLFDALFVSTLAWALVPDFVLALSLKSDMAAQARAAYKAIKEEAIGADLSQGDEAEPESDFLSVRN